MLGGLLLNLPRATGISRRRPRWCPVDEYAPDCKRARTAKRKEVTQALVTLKTHFLPPFLQDAVSIAEEYNSAGALMKDNTDLIIIMLAYYNYLRWKAKDRRDIEAFMVLAMG